MSKTTKLSAYSGTLLSKYWQLTLLFKSMGHLELSKTFAIKGLKIAERKKKFKQAFKFADYLKSYHLLMRWDLRAFCKMEHKAADYLLLFNEEQHLKNIYFSLTFQLSVQRYPSYGAPSFEVLDFETIQIGYLAGNNLLSKHLGNVGLGADFISQFIDSEDLFDSKYNSDISSE